MKSLSLQLRAANALSVCCAIREGHRGPRMSLAPRMRRFSEGFQTADLTEARALLAQL
jgi:hypothetical protein